MHVSFCFQLSFSTGSISRYYYYTSVFFCCAPPKPETRFVTFLCNVCCKTRKLQKLLFSGDSTRLATTCLRINISSYCFFISTCHIYLKINNDTKHQHVNIPTISAFCNLFWSMLKDLLAVGDKLAQAESNIPFARLCFTCRDLPSV